MAALQTHAAAVNLFWEDDVDVVGFHHGLCGGAYIKAQYMIHGQWDRLMLRGRRM